MLSDQWFDYYSPTKISFESGSFQRLAERITRFGTRFLIVNLRKDNQNPEGLKQISDAIAARADGCVVYDEIIGNPDTEQIDTATYFARRAHADCIIGYGSVGSMEAAKAVALMANNSFFAEELFDKSDEAVQPPLPVITIPNEPCMGEELNGYFTLVDAHHNTRKCYSSELLFPSAVFYNIILCSHLKRDDAARIASAMMSYAIERLISGKTNVITDTILTKVIETLKQDVLAFYNDPGNEKVIRNMLWSSCMTGMSIMHEPNGAVWSMAQVLSTKTKLNFHLAHAILLPYVMEYFLTSSSKKYVSIARVFGEDLTNSSVIEGAIQSIEAIRNMFASLNLPTRLSEFYITETQIKEISYEVETYPHLANAPKKLTASEIESILLTAL